MLRAIEESRVSAGLIQVGNLDEEVKIDASLEIPAAEEEAKRISA